MCLGFGQPSDLHIVMLPGNLSTENVRKPVDNIRASAPST